MRKPSLLVGCLLAIGLIATGCGGDDDGDGGEAMSREEFVAQGNQICEEGNAEVEAEGRELFGTGQPTEQEFQAFVSETLLPNVRGQIEDLRALQPPEGDEETINGILDDAEAVVDDLEANPESLQRGNPFAEVNRQLDEYGLTVCASG